MLDITEWTLLKMCLVKNAAEELGISVSAWQPRHSTQPISEELSKKIVKTAKYMKAELVFMH
jgi:hypothetical protein